MMTVVLYILAAVIVLLVIALAALCKKLNRISCSLEEVLKGNYNQRIRMQNHIKPLSTLCNQINVLTDLLQAVMQKNIEHEAARKKMISNISHDLRTPMTSLLGYVEMLKTNDTLNGEERDRYLDIIQAKGFVLYDLIETFFQLAKLEAEDVRLELEAVNLSEVIRQSIVLLYHDFKHLDLEPEIDLPERDVYISGNREAINRILDNLISNGLKYGIDGKTIGIRLWAEEKHALVEVWDKGKGIPEEELPRLFERMYTLEKSRNTRYQGSGLGLTIAKKLVELQGGWIKANSSPGVKTAFTFCLPLSKKP